MTLLEYHDLRAKCHVTQVDILYTVLDIKHWITYWTSVYEEQECTKILYKYEQNQCIEETHIYGETLALCHSEDESSLLFSLELYK